MVSGTSHIWALLIGEIVAGGLVVAIVYWRRRQRKLRKERSPVDTRLLRPPGHSISVELQAKEERLLWVLMVLVACSAFVAFDVSVLATLWPTPEVKIVVAQHGGWVRMLSQESLLSKAVFAGCLTIAGVSGAVYGFVSVLKVEKELRWLRLGLRGEQAVAEKLIELAPDGYRAFHDFPAGKDWNIDHVAVGPGGVFAIETKARSKRKAPPGRKDQEVFYDGKCLKFPWFTDDKAVTQAKANAHWLAKYLKEATGLESVWVNALLVIPGWYVVNQSNPMDHTVRAMPETALLKHLRGRRRMLSDEMIQRIAFQLEQKCRDVEF